MRGVEIHGENQDDLWLAISRAVLQKQARGSAGLLDKWSVCPVPAGAIPAAPTPGNIRTCLLETAPSSESLLLLLLPSPSKIK